MTETVDIAALSGIDLLRLGMTGGFIAPSPAPSASN